jgi:hypothetical protein
MKKNITILIIAVIIAAGIGFYGGMMYGKAGAKSGLNSLAARGNFTGANARTGTRTNAAGGGFTNGQILSKSNTSLTIKLAAGGSEIVFLAPSSQIMKSATTTIDNLNVGDNVMVTGTTNPDGSITAKTIQVGDFRFGGAGRPATSTQGQAQGGQIPARPINATPGQ